MMQTFWLIAAALLSGPADMATDGTKTSDPNRVVCAKETVTGSRLGAKKICRTVVAWAEMQRLDRQTAERLQMNRYNGNESAGGAIHGDLSRNN